MQVRVPRGFARLMVAAVVGVAPALVLVGPSATAAVPARAAAPSAVAAPVVGDPAAGSIPVLPKSSAFIFQVYAALLGRPASRAETAFWGSRVDAGSAASAVAPIVYSNEYLSAVVGSGYAPLGRAPDAPGRAFWLDQLQHGLTAEGMAVGVLSSREFYAKASGTSSGFVAALYPAIFGRPADPGGQAYWTQQLDQGVPRFVVAFQLIHSAEHSDQLVTLVYRQVFGRAVDPGAAAYWRQRFMSDQIGTLALTIILLSSDEATTTGCDPTQGRDCLLPFPNDYYTVPDAQSLTGKRVALRSSMLPANSKGGPVDPSQSNRSDGFAVGQAALVSVPGIDLAKTGAAPITNIGASLNANAPIFVVDADTGERIPVWAELDSNAPAGQPQNQLLYIRPARNYTAGHRYVVVMRNLVDGNGAAIPASDTFARYRDNLADPGNVDHFEARRPHVSGLLDDLVNKGLTTRHEVFLAWDFTVASTMNTTGRLLHIRDDAFNRLGSASPTFHVTQVDDPGEAGIARRVQGTYSVPSYLTQDAPGGQFLEGPDGLPVYSGHDLTTTFTCIIPTASLTTAGRPVVYGHGLFGGQGEVNSNAETVIAANHDMVYCATDWLGMASPDLGTAAGILNDLSTFPKLADRVQQGVVAQLFLGKLLTHPQGFASDPAFSRTSTGNSPSVIDPTEVFYDGNSQGGILGGITTAVSNQWTRAVLGVTGMNFTTLVERSVDFAPFEQIAAGAYPDELQRTLLLDVIQMQWDRSEPDGYAAYLTDHPLPNTPAHKVLMHVAVGDHQVATITADNEARTAGIPAHQPALAPGRSTDVTPLWGIAAIPSYPFDGSGYVYWDSGSPLPPTTNTPPSAGHDPHEDPRRSPLAQQQKSDFLAVNGAVTDPCNGQPCTAPQT